jgi:hypothetical protein
MMLLLLLSSSIKCATGYNDFPSLMTANATMGAFITQIKILLMLSDSSCVDVSMCPFADFNFLCQVNLAHILESFSFYKHNNSRIVFYFSHISLKSLSLRIIFLIRIHLISLQELFIEFFR